jgi:hypothetical protein
MTQRIDLTGQKFGKLTVIKYSYTGKPRGIAFFLCKCDCGEITTVSSGHLKSGHTQSCGCFQIEQAKNSSINNTWGRKYKNSQDASARTVWQCSYSDGCSLEKFLELSQLPCYYCGTPPSNSFNKYLTKEGKLTNQEVSNEWAEQATYIYNGLDRLDSSKDHDENNIVPCCIICNRAKHAMTLEDFAAWIIRVSNHFLKKEKAE